MRNCDANIVKEERRIKEVLAIEKERHRLCARDGENRSVQRNGAHEFLN